MASHTELLHLSGSKDLSAASPERPAPHDRSVRTFIAFSGRTDESVGQPADTPAQQALWVQAICNGDSAAFDAVFRTYYSGLCSFVSSYLDDSEVSEELVQDVFVDLWKRRRRAAPSQQLRPFLYRAAKNKALNYLRHERVEDRLRREAAIALQNAPQTPEDRFRYQQLSDLIDTAVRLLPERCRQAFLLSRKGGLSYAEIAELMDISIKTVETQMGRALRTIRAALRE